MTAALIDHRRPSPRLRDSGLWVCETVVEKFHGDDTTTDPYEVHILDNLLAAGGASALWECLLGNGGSGTLAYFNAANAAIGVGDSTTAEVATQTDLQAASNKLRKGMNAGFPTHTDGFVVGAQTIQFQATFATSEANFTWNEVVVANSTAAGGGRILNRKVAALGTKTSASAWQITTSIGLGV